jgi:hypothetical protein
MSVTDRLSSHTAIEAKNNGPQNLKIDHDCERTKNRVQKNCTPTEDLLDKTRKQRKFRRLVHVLPLLQHVL